MQNVKLLEHLDHACLHRGGGEGGFWNNALKPARMPRTTTLHGGADKKQYIASDDCPVLIIHDGNRDFMLSGTSYEDFDAAGVRTSCN